MVEALADRLAEAFAEKLHQIVRKELWAYAPNEDFSTEDLLKVKYQGMWYLIVLSAFTGRNCCQVQLSPATSIPKQFAKISMHLQNRVLG